MSQPIGGQAVLEGVMMRGASNWAVAIRKPDGDIAQVSRPVQSAMARHWVLRLPIIRGVVALGVISLLPDLRRVFQYHAAERKAINAYEAGEKLEPERVQKFSLIHPRCGTAFLLWVMVIAIFVFAFFGRPHWYWLVVTRIALLPVIAGLAYELIRFAGKHTDNRWLLWLLAPGLWLQRLTTREPTLDQLEVSIKALSEVIEREGLAGDRAQRVEVMA